MKGRNVVVIMCDVCRNRVLATLIGVSFILLNVIIVMIKNMIKNRSFKNENGAKKAVVFTVNL